jgi:hypothetical protein
MNNNEHNESGLNDALRWQLRAMRRDVEPSADLWSGIAARLSETRPAAHRTQRWFRPVAMAASVLLVVGTVGWFGRSSNLVSPQPQAPTLVQREADNMIRQYQAALIEFEAAPVPASLQPTIEDLDRNAALIREALARDPDSVLLLEQLRRTYAHRLALAQRVAYT